MFLSVCVVRYGDTSSGEHFFGHPDLLPERPCGDKPVQFPAGDEHLLRPAAPRQHLRGVWQVQ